MTTQTTVVVIGAGPEAEAAEPYFVGFGNPPTGQLFEIREQAPFVAQKIAGTEGWTQ